MYLSIVIPVHNESGNLRALINEIQDSIGELPEVEIVVVDDGSTDDTLADLSAIQREEPRLRIVRHPRRCGQSAALLSGVRAAHAAWVAVLDGDGQNPPSEIPRLLSARISPDTAVLVAGIRRHRNDTVVRRISSRFANLIRSALLHDDCPDTGCGLKLFPRDFYLSLPHFDHMHRFLPALAHRAGIEVVFVEVDHRSRTHGTSKYGVLDRLWVGITDIAGVMWLNRRICSVEATEIRHV